MAFTSEYVRDTKKFVKTLEKRLTRTKICGMIMYEKEDEDMINQIIPGNDLAAKLRALRASRNKTQTQVAQDLGLKQQTYSNYEKEGAKVDSATLKKICEYYHVSADDLIGVAPTQQKIETEVKQSYSITDKATVEHIINEVFQKLNQGK